MVRVLTGLETVEHWLEMQTDVPAAAHAAVAVAEHVRRQDVEVLPEHMLQLRRGVAKDRRISVEDGAMRHGRKSKSHLFDGFKRHVLRDLDSRLIRAVGITPANVPEASVTGDLMTDLEHTSRDGVP